MEKKHPLIIENLSFRYRMREELAIKDINLKIEAGQIVLIAGASGCGKTTLIRCINGLIPRSYKGDLSGKIILDSIDTLSLTLAQISQLVGTVLQDPERQILGSKVINEVAFGVGPRTWLVKLDYKTHDRILIVFSLLMFLASVALSLLGFGKFWIPPSLIALFS